MSDVLLPRLAPHVQLAGELRGTGFRDRQWLIQRNGRFLQVTELLYRIAELADGQRTFDELAAAVSGTVGRLISPDQVRYLVETNLIPHGLVAAANGLPIARPTHSTRSPLAVNMRVRLLGPTILVPIARVLQPLYAPPVAIPLVVAIVLTHVWLCFSHGIVASMRAALFNPGGVLLLLGLLAISSMFHELGHAAALGYGGGTVRGMGAGLYIIYPVLYTDVTDSYRLGRWARLRTDIGGFYFHLIFAVGLVLVGRATGWELLLFGMPLIDLAILRQCLPFVRFDGYWIMADLSGLPDFFAAIGPFLASLLPKGRGRVALPALKRHARLALGLYLALTIPLLTLLYVLMVRGLPSFVSTLLDAIRLQTIFVRDAWQRADAVQLPTAALQIVFLALPMLGISYMLYSTGRRSMLALLRWSKPSPLRRAVAGLIAASIAGLVGIGWAPQLATLVATDPAGVQHFTVDNRSHVTGAVAYAQDPPVGGSHAPIWLNCGFYAEPVAAEYAVHSLEHGAVWITYRPDLPADDVATLRHLTRGHSYVIASPYPGMQTPAVASAWGRQLALESVDDPRLTQFVRAFERGPQAPEPTQPCSGGVGPRN